MPPKKGKKVGKAQDENKNAAVTEATNATAATAAEGGGTATTTEATTGTSLSSSSSATFLSVAPAPPASSSSGPAATVTSSSTLTTSTAAPTFCKVAECRFASTHVTAAHQCGKCGLFGHGQVECDDQAAKDALIPHTADRIPPSLQCTLVGCRFRHSHVNSAHQCGKCAGRGHSAMACPSFPLAGSASTTSSSTSGSASGGSSGSSGGLGFIGTGWVGGGLGGPMFGIKGSGATTFASSSAGASISFLCPICRVQNNVRTSQPNVYNVEVDCVVCNDAKAQVFNPQCGHVCLCWACAKDLKS